MASLCSSLCTHCDPYYSLIFVLSTVILLSQLPDTGSQGVLTPLLAVT